MPSPTRRLTARAAQVLHDDVVLAVRVRQGPYQRTETPARPRTPYQAWIERSSTTATLPAGGLPVVPMFRSLKQLVTDQFSGNHRLNGVLAIARSGERILMGRSRFRSLRPSAATRRLRRDEPISIDMKLLNEKLIPEIKVGDEYFIVNAVDFGVMTKKVVNGDLDEPWLADQLTPYYENVKALATYDPVTVHSIIVDQTKPKEVGDS